MDNESLSEFFEQYEFDAAAAVSSCPEDIFKVLETLETGFNNPVGPFVEPCNYLSLKDGEVIREKKSMAGSEKEMVVNEGNSGHKCKRQKLSCSAINGGYVEEGNNSNGNGQQKMAHITVERNRRKQMNEHLSILRSLMPCFYVKRGDQASVIGGVVNYISELQQILQSLEAKKQRKVFSELSPRIVSPSPLSPHKPPISPRLITGLPVSPRTPPSITTTTTSNTPYNNPMLLPYVCSYAPPPSSTTSSAVDGGTVNELVANSKSAIADVEVKFSGANVLVQTVSQRIQGQAVKIIGALENINLEILQVNITTFEETMICSFTIKIGIECELSVDDLAHLVQKTFC